MQSNAGFIEDIKRTHQAAAEGGSQVDVADSHHRKGCLKNG